MHNKLHGSCTGSCSPAGILFTGEPQFLDMLHMQVNFDHHSAGLLCWRVFGGWNLCCMFALESGSCNQVVFNL